MLRHTRLLVTVFVLAFGIVFVFLPHSAAAFNPFQNACSNTGVTNTPGKNPSTVCTTSGQNPIGGTNGILYKVGLILSTVSGIAAVILMIVGGFNYVTAAGDPNKAANARRTMIAAGIGLLVILLAQAILALAVNIVK